jgi:hypothetical protein
VAYKPYMKIISYITIMHCGNCANYSPTKTHTLLIKTHTHKTDSQSLQEVINTARMHAYKSKQKKNPI